MKIYRKTNGHLLCGHWNGSPMEIGLTDVIKAIPDSETYHYHNYHEYYIIIRGKGTLRVEGRDEPLEANAVVMIQLFVDREEELRFLEDHYSRQ